MTSIEIISLVVTAIGVLSFSIIFTILYVSYAGSTIVEVRAGKRDVDIIDDAIYDLQAGVKSRKKLVKVIKRILTPAFFRIFALSPKQPCVRTNTPIAG